MHAVLSTTAKPHAHHAWQSQRKGYKQQTTYTAAAGPALPHPQPAIKHNVAHHPLSWYASRRTERSSSEDESSLEDAERRLLRLDPLRPEDLGRALGERLEDPRASLSLPPREWFLPPACDQDSTTVSSMDTGPQMQYARQPSYPPRWQAQCRQPCATLTPAATLAVLAGGPLLGVAGGLTATICKAAHHSKPYRSNNRACHAYCITIT